jgi:hypothetical protein
MAFNAGIVAGALPTQSSLSEDMIGLSPTWYVKLDEPAPHYIGQPCIDYSGNALTATYNAAQGSDADPLFAGSYAALKFNTLTEITGPTITRSDVNEAFSVSYFIKGPATTATRRIIGTTTTSEGFTVETSSTSNRGAILLQLTTAGTRFTDTSGNIWDDSPHHIVITVAQVSGNIEISMYTDGVLTFFNDATVASMKGTSWPLTLGTLSFESTLDEVAFWQRRLSAEEVLSIWDARNEAGPPFIPSFTGILDAYQTDLYYACSARHLISTYRKPLIRVMRTSDNAQQDIYGDSSGGLDISALTTFVGASDAYVSVWFDQTGNERHITQSTTVGNRGKIVIAGVVQYNGSHPAAAYPTAVRDVAGNNSLLGFTHIVTASGLDTSAAMGSTTNSGSYHGHWQSGSGSARFVSPVTASVDRVDGVTVVGTTRGDLYTALAAAGASPLAFSSSRTNSSGIWKNDPLIYLSAMTPATVTDRIGYSTDSVTGLGTIESGLKVGM